MARQVKQQTRKKATETRKSASGRKPAGGNAASMRSRHSSTPSSRFIDERMRRDIAGVAFIVASVVLLLVSVLPSGEDAIVTHYASTGVKAVFGVGCYVLPVVLAAIGITFLVRFERERVPLRVAIGLAVIFVALLGFISLFTPVDGVSGSDLSLLFSPLALASHGGYVGAAIAWVGLSLFGQVISCVILAGIMLIGAIIIGFSLSSLIEKIRNARSAHREAAEAARAKDGGEVVAAPPFARVRRTRSRSVENGLSAAETSVLPAAHAQAPAAGKTEALDRSGTASGSDRTERMEARQARRENKRHRADRPVAQAAAVTQMLPLAIDESESRSSEPVSMTRKLGKKNKPREDAPAMRPKSSNASPTALPHPQDGFTLPSMSLLAKSSSLGKSSVTDDELTETAARLQETLEDFTIMAEVVGWVAGPTVTLFKVDLPAGVRVSRVMALNDDIALALAAPGVRIFAPIPGTNYVGIEVPNKTRQTVLLSDVLSEAGEGPLQIAIGKDVEGHSIVTDLAKMPHLLIGGTTGSGKSVSINAMIMSILMRATPAEVRFIMIDPKRVEFTPYNGIPHLYVPVVTEAREAASALSWGVAEMERRLKVFSKVGARNIGQFNAKVQQAKAEAEAAEKAGEDFEPWKYDDELPYIVIIIDELADLMMNVGKEVEFSISRIAQLARAAGIHLIVATQRPSANVVTGLIKANITNRIAFNVASSIDSRVVLDSPGAENLIGLGDLLFSKPEYPKPQRIQGCYVSEDEINAVVTHLKEQGEPEYHSEILSTNVITLGASSPDGAGGSSSDDPLLWEAADIVVSSGLGSTSNIQRRLKVGHPRAGRIMDQLEEKGVVGPSMGPKPRDVLVDAMELETLKAFEMNDEAAGSSHTEG